jgi:hypothetical protein
MKILTALLLSGALVCPASFGWSQSASTTGSGASSTGPTGSAATGGTGGSAAAGGTSASTLGLGATSTDRDGNTSSALGTGGTAAGGTKQRSSSKVTGGADNMHGQSKARAQDRGTWSDSKTKTKIHKGVVDSRTKSMAHQPGGPPTKSTTRSTTPQ